jgi:Metallo-peptidase family M12B Reprolysin-like
MKIRILVTTYGLVTVLCAALAVNSTANAAEALIKEKPHNIYHVIKNKTLAQATDQIANRSGISFKINAANLADVVSRKLAADDWKTALGQLLQGYNYTTVLANGAIKTVIITGHNGSGQTSANDVVVIQPGASNKLPGIFKNFKSGSVMPVNLPLAKLNATPVGNKVTLDLPIGQYEINHDNLVKHDDGSSTWMGYLDAEGKGYRVYLSEGSAGLMGNIYTPDGTYNIETVGGQTLLVDLKNSGLQTAGYENDQAQPVVGTQANFESPGIGKRLSNANTAAASISSGIPTKTANATAKSTASGPTVDLMVIYTTAKQTAAYAKQRALYFVDTANQAYKDSKINMRLRLVHTRASKYIENNNNDTALDDLASDKGAFYGTSALRTKYGADLVMLLRPLYAKTAGGCGVAYVGFARGKAADADNAYGVIGNGYSKDALTNYYCDTSTFAHEIGHSLGNVHDREYTSFPGKFSYSYAWGIDGKFGTIMSYKSPSLMLFSTPLLPSQCAGVACGYAEGSFRSSDQSKTTNYTAPFVANFKPKTVTTAVIQ